MEEIVDVLLTTYNSNIDYLKKQIDSVLNQTYKNIKLIISDDCSSNEDVKVVLKEYEEKDSRVKVYFQEKNLGYTKNFEFVLTKSEGDYVAFCDHDDIWYENKIEMCLKSLKEQNVDLVYCDAKQIDENGKVINESYLRYKKLPILNNKKYNKIIPFSRHIAIGCSQLFTKEVRQKMIPFTDNTIAHDWHNLFIASRLKGVYCIDKPLFEYRLHGNNAFGGRSFKQNMKIWKEKNGKNFSSYLLYRKRVITETYLAGVQMCESYNKENEDKKYLKDEEKVIRYFEKAQTTKVLYFPIHKYFKYMYFKGIKSRVFKELMILHFPIISFLVFTCV